MRIGLLAPPWVSVPPRGYGGTEVVVDNLARGLSRRGHEVTLFTVGDSTCPVHRLHLHRHPAQRMGDTTAEAAHVLAGYAALRDVEVIHDHTVLGPLLAARGAAGSGPSSVPVVATNHGPFHSDAQRVYAEAAAGGVAVVAISHAHAASAGRVRLAATILHGVDLTRYRPGPGTGGYLLFLGRMSQDKGVHRAITVARRAGWPIVVVARACEENERAYFEGQVRPLLGDGVQMLGELGAVRTVELLQGAAALLVPITWPEPFGLVMAEAMACGTPVLAFPNGAAPEVVRDGVTGFLCADEDEMVLALRRLPSLDRRVIRAEASRRFSAERMVAEHERLYAGLLEARTIRMGAAPAVVAG